MFPPAAGPSTAAAPMGQPFGQAPALANAGVGDVASLDDAKLLEIYEACKKEGFDQRHIYERLWLRNIYYRLGRQWIFYDSFAGWRDMRLARGIPRPVTSKPAEIEQSIRAMFAAVKIGVTIRPNGRSPKNVITAATADDLAPILHDIHDMNAVMNEFDYWFILNGNAVLHSYWDESSVYGVSTIPYEQCAGCGLQLRQDQIAAEGQKCPACGNRQFTPAVDPSTGAARVDTLPKGQAATTPLSMLEVAFPLTYPRWKDVPFLIRMRWRDKRYYEQHPDDSVRSLVDQIAWQKSPTERSLQIFKSLPFHSDLGTANRGWDVGSGPTEGSGIAEYELWHRPNGLYKNGLVMRVVGDQSPIVLHSESEGLPGELPYRDRDDRPLFTFSHGAYEHVGGRVLGSGALDPVIPKFDQLNRLDSLIEMIVSRMANPVWKIPKNAEVEWLGDSPGLPGLLIQWNPLAAGGNASAEPKREPGIPIDQSLMMYREVILKEIDEAAGTFDILRGAKPAGVEAFSALQLLVERGQARFSTAFTARGAVYQDWAKWALELERAYGPDERTIAVMTPTRGWFFKSYKKSQLQGDFSIVVEDGTQTPKTTLGRRAAIEHANQLKVLPIVDPDTQYAILQEFGLTTLVPGLDHNVSAALNRQEAFEDWLRSGQAAQIPPQVVQDPMMFEQWKKQSRYPLAWKRWYDPMIGRQECLKWANSDRMQDLLTQYPQAEGLLEAYLMEIDLAIQEKQQGQMDPAGLAEPPQQPPSQPSTGVGAGQASANSNRNSAPAGNTPQPPAP